jgi:hypothetical protein
MQAVILLEHSRKSDEETMSERSTFERDVRAALRAEAEAGPDYEAVLHAQVMQRVRRALATTDAPPTQASAAPTRRVMLMAMLLGAVAILVVVFLFFQRWH